MRSVQTTLTRIFIVLESVSHDLSEKLRRNFSESSEILRFFPPKIRWSPKKKKKKGLHRISDCFFGRNRKFKRFFRPKSGGLQKKRSSPNFRLIFRPQSEIQRFFPPKIRWSPNNKKRSSPNFRLIFRPKSEIQTFAGGLFSDVGLFSIFHKKSASKPPKRCDFAYFTSQWGARAPPTPPGYATACK